MEQRIWKGRWDLYGVEDESEVIKCLQGSQSLRGLQCYKKSADEAGFLFATIAMIIDTLVGVSLDAARIR